MCKEKNTISFSFRNTLLIFRWSRFSGLVLSLIMARSNNHDFFFSVLDNSIAKLDRLSGSQAESGFCSMPSRRSSCQSYSASSQQLSSTRSSQQSYTSQESHHTERVSVLSGVAENGSDRLSQRVEVTPFFFKCPKINHILFFLR